MCSIFQYLRYLLCVFSLPQERVLHLSFIFIFLGQLDSNWCIGAVLEKKLAPFPFTLALSGYANHVKSQYRFGIGMIIG